MFPDYPGYLAGDPRSVFLCTELLVQNMPSDYRNDTNRLLVELTVAVDKYLTTT